MDRKIIGISILCGHCKTRFPSPISFEAEKSLETAIVTGNTAQCPGCGKDVDCNTENMSWVYEGGNEGVVGPDFGIKR